MVNAMLREDSYAGKQFGNYRITRRLARGGYGNVYLAEHVLLPRQAAIKFLHPELCGSGPKRQDFLQEAQLLEQLKHPHILPIYDVSAGDEDFPPCLIVEYAPGGSLWERLRRMPGPLPLAESLTILEQIAQALQHAHQQVTPIVHRDLKPENILFNPKGQALLCDFGIAVVLDTAATQRVDVAGTLLYMAPEQFEGLASPRSDQYALGCLAYELVTGRRPITAESGQWMEWALKHREVTPVSPSRLNPQLPLSIERVILRALAKNRAERFATIAAFAHALRAASPEAERATAVSVDAVVPAPITPPRIAPDPRVLLDRAYRLFALKRYEEALAIYEQAIASDPRSAAAYYGKGIIMLEQERYTSALEAFEQAIVRDPTFARAYLGKGIALFNMRAYRKALDAYEQALAYDQDEIGAYYGKGDALAKLKHSAEARLAYEEAVRHDNASIADERRGNALFILERYDEALVVYNQLLQGAPDDPDLLECRGNTLRKLGRAREADQAYARASELRGFV
jgi:tetratricopeptide (TPR) repeat protein/tRNA A-37 threonylcarbamoyl transferase component Bud32